MQGMNFSARVAINLILKYESGQLISPSSVSTFDPMDGVSVISNLKLTHKNAYVMDVEVTSYPDTSHGFKAVSNPIIVQPVSSLTQ